MRAVRQVYPRWATRVHAAARTSAGSTATKLSFESDANTDPTQKSARQPHEPVTLPPARLTQATAKQNIPTVSFGPIRHQMASCSPHRLKNANASEASGGKRNHRSAT